MSDCIRPPRRPGDFPSFPQPFEHCWASCLFTAEWTSWNRWAWWVGRLPHHQVAPCLASGPGTWARILKSRPLTRQLPTPRYPAIAGPPRSTSRLQIGQPGVTGGCRATN
ncbi:hypothetical protein VTK56DRAFT_7851 [Thermocarpiscus australiensis]